MASQLSKIPQSRIGTENAVFIIIIITRGVASSRKHDRRSPLYMSEVNKEGDGQRNVSRPASQNLTRSIGRVKQVKSNSEITLSAEETRRAFVLSSFSLRQITANHFPCSMRDEERLEKARR